MENQKVTATGFNFPPYLIQDFFLRVPEHYKPDGDAAIEVRDNEFSGIRHHASLTFKAPGYLQPFKFPIDPFISLSFKNSITRRQVSKGSTRGTIKERWTQDDVEITITGIFISDTIGTPIEVDHLYEYYDLHKAIQVQCSILNNPSIGINYIVIESIDLPFTKGMNNQAFQIKAYSDDVFHLLKQTNNAV